MDLEAALTNFAEQIEALRKRMEVRDLEQDRSPAA